MFRLYVRRWKKIFKIFFKFEVFPGKSDSIILLTFECTINPQNLIEVVRAFLRKSKFLIFLLCELPLILGLGEKIKTGRDICERTLDMDFQQDRSIGLGSTFGDGKTYIHTYIQTDRQTHRHFF